MYAGEQKDEEQTARTWSKIIYSYTSTSKNSFIAPKISKCTDQQATFFGMLTAYIKSHNRREKKNIDERQVIKSTGDFVKIFLHIACCFKKYDFLFISIGSCDMHFSIAKKWKLYQHYSTYL